MITKTPYLVIFNNRSHLGDIGPRSFVKIFLRKLRKCIFIQALDFINGAFVDAVAEVNEKPLHHIRQMLIVFAVVRITVAVAITFIPIAVFLVAISSGTAIPPIILE